jgi:YHS domain-containing protein
VFLDMLSSPDLSEMRRSYGSLKKEERMKKLLSFLTIVCFVFLSVMPLTAETLKPKDVDNKICPVSGRKIEGKSKVTYEYKGTIYNFCSVSCINEFKKDPGKYIQAVKDELRARSPRTHKGTIIDNMCAEAHKGDLAEFIKTHPKSCALKPDCAASGYSFYFDGYLVKFDNASSVKVEEFLKQKDSKLEVIVTLSKQGKGIASLISINNQ